MLWSADKSIMPILMNLQKGRFLHNQHLNTNREKKSSEVVYKKNNNNNFDFFFN